MFFLDLGGVDLVSFSGVAQHRRPGWKRDLIRSTRSTVFRLEAAHRPPVVPVYIFVRLTEYPAVSVVCSSRVKKVRFSPDRTLPLCQYNYCCPCNFGKSLSRVLRKVPFRTIIKGFTVYSVESDSLPLTNPGLSCILNLFWLSFLTSGGRVQCKTRSLIKSWGAPGWRIFWLTRQESLTSPTRSERHEVHNKISEV